MPELRAQRTLVKSPPELWAQVSDPVSLARHLGEFGEIKITRVVPEQTVAWEGERASGTVELSSSGWGTKVTLVARLADDAEPGSQPEPAAGEAPPAPTRPTDPFELINSLAREPLARTPEPLDTTEPEADWDASSEPVSEEPAAPLQAAHAAPPALPEAQKAEAQQAETQQAETQQAETQQAETPETDAPPEHLDAADGDHFEQPYAAADATVDQEHGYELDAWFSQSPDPTHAAGDPSAWAGHAPATSATGTRPGFFARLFGKRRGAKSQLTELPTAQRPTEHGDAVSLAPIPEHEAAPTETEAAWTEHEAAPTETDAAWTQHEATPTETEPAWTEHEATPTETDAAWTEHEVPPTETDEPPSIEHGLEPTETADAASTEHEAALAEADDEAPAAPAPPPEPTATEPEPAHELPEPADNRVEALDPARAEAVLTAVLDDLGAARHRPFSRG